MKKLGNVIKMLKTPTTITVSVCYYIYKLTEQWIISLGRFLECNILVISQALVLCLIYICTRRWVSCIYIRQSTLASVITYRYTHTYMQRWRKQFYIGHANLSTYTCNYVCSMDRFECMESNSQGLTTYIQGTQGTQTLLCKAQSACEICYYQWDLGACPQENYEIQALSY